MRRAWPVARGQSGNRAFFVNQAGDVLVCKNDQRQYSGFGNTPQPTAAYDQGGSMAEPYAENALGGDGQKWVVVN